MMAASFNEIKAIFKKLKSVQTNKVSFVSLPMVHGVIGTRINSIPYSVS